MRLFCDWGTSSFRLFLVNEQGDVVTHTASSQGVSRLPRAEQPAYLLAQAQQLVTSPADLDVLICGMAGSGLGLANAGYQACPADARQLARHLVPVTVPSLGRVQLVPGLSDEQTGADVMRGEETQLLGWLCMSELHQHGQHRVCLPGTHSKWVQVQEGVIRGFSTAFTGELYGLLVSQSTLKPATDSHSDEGFQLGLDASRSKQPLLNSLFTTRSKVLLYQMPAECAASYLSGLLIGTEVREFSAAGDGPVHIIANGRLSALYAKAMAFYQLECQVHQGDGLSVAGLGKIAELM
ncbi:2-dehydro-3-deoxygalactonokinase [Simiduia agarivorans]|uniref:2-dehydro-3-deoxygalactonokinase n=1 Tax=Simiduia agarivorans (strain DSM 21679 / JCM 13881 / BCRC 17597 / SA1) TaxID=1117647 RepID=K4L2V3_SIMAS|nr:2-dehydro-3-deoxygalactonokinase [Simiduia agarivorans]AFV00528.1 2-dehydro-3-deoxygalactonokinase [Simiduia agarivorans SA1 = DSM 21679]